MHAFVASICYSLSLFISQNMIFIEIYQIFFNGLLICSSFLIIFSIYDTRSNIALLIVKKERMIAKYRRAEEKLLRHSKNSKMIDISLDELRRANSLSVVMTDNDDAGDIERIERINHDNNRGKIISNIYTTNNGYNLQHNSNNNSSTHNSNEKSNNTTPRMRINTNINTNRGNTYNFNSSNNNKNNNNNSRISNINTRKQMTNNTSPATDSSTNTNSQNNTPQVATLSNVVNTNSASNNNNNNALNPSDLKIHPNTSTNLDTLMKNGLAHTNNNNNNNNNSTLQNINSAASTSVVAGNNVTNLNVSRLPIQDNSQQFPLAPATPDRHLRPMNFTNELTPDPPMTLPGHGFIINDTSNNAIGGSSMSITETQTKTMTQEQYQQHQHQLQVLAVQQQGQTVVTTNETPIKNELEVMGLAPNNSSAIPPLNTQLSGQLVGPFIGNTNDDGENVTIRVERTLSDRGQTIQQKAEIDKERKQRRVRINIIKETQILKDLKRGKLKLDVLTSCLVFISMFERLWKSVLQSVDM